MRGGFIQLNKAMVSVLHNKLEYKLEKLKYKKAKVDGHAAENQKQF